MSAGAETVRRLTVGDIARMYADGRRIAMLTAYDFPTAKLLDEAGIPLLLVGDSLGRVMLGYENEIPVSMADMLHHTAAVVRGAKQALVVGDMPFLTYATPEQAVANGGRFLAEAGAQAVKVEGGVRSARTIEVLVKAGIPTMGHIGWTPQAANAAGKVRVLGKSREQARALLHDALAVQEAGAFSIVLELVPEQLAAAITERLNLLGWDSWHPRHAKPYADLRGTILAAARSYAEDVVAGTFPGPDQTVRMADDVLDEVLGKGAFDRRAEEVPEGIPLDRDL